MAPPRRAPHLGRVPTPITKPLPDGFTSLKRGLAAIFLSSSLGGADSSVLCDGRGSGWWCLRRGEGSGWSLVRGERANAAPARSLRAA